MKNFFQKFSGIDKNAITDDFKDKYDYWSGDLISEPTAALEDLLNTYTGITPNPGARWP